MDASVLVKWVLPDANEEGTAEALKLLSEVGQGFHEVLQPPHWLAEVTAVLSRVRPELAENAIDLLDAMDFPVAGDAAVLKRASRIAHALNQHVFDTLYHAVALEADCTLITADERYLRKASRLGSARSLRSWRAQERR